MIRVEELTNVRCAKLAEKTQETQSGVAEAMINNPRYAEMIARVGPCASFTADGEVIAAAGLIDFVGSGRALIWCVFAANIGRHFAPLLKRMERMLANYPRRRLEAHIDPNFEASRRLVEISGFQYEGLMKSHSADGRDMQLWARINEGAAWLGQNSY